MVFAKIDPVATFYKQTDPFNSTAITGSYIMAITRPYALGSTTVNFYVSYGNVIFDETGSVINFETIITNSVVMSGSAIENWGIDDADMLSKIAALQGTSITEIVSGNIVM